MARIRKLELIQRSLGIRHKLKVHESLKAPDTHEELALMMLAKWELEDELRAIEEVLAGTRLRNVATKRRSIGEEDESLLPEEREAAAGKRIQANVSKSKRPKPGAT